MLIHRRTPSIILPEDPSQEELLQCWTLSARDREEVLRCRGEANRRRFAVQLCTLRAYGRFVPEATAAPAAITHYLARQLDLPLVLFGEPPGRLATETEQLQRIRDYLGWSLFDAQAPQRLVHWRTQRATDDVLPLDLVSRAEAMLRSGQRVLPARSTLEALVDSITAGVQDAVSIRIAEGLPPELQRAMEDLLEVPSQFSWVDQRVVRERYIDQLSHEACALSLFLVTVADAQGLRFYSERSLCQRLSMTPAVLRQARQALIACALVAYQSSLYQVLALEGDARPPAAARLPLSGDDEPVDLKAVFTQIWEVLS